MFIYKGNISKSMFCSLQTVWMFSHTHSHWLNANDRQLCQRVWIPIGSTSQLHSIPKHKFKRPLSSCYHDFHKY